MGGETWEMDDETRRALSDCASVAITRGDYDRALAYADEIERGGYGYDAESIRQEVYYTAPAVRPAGGLDNASTATARPQLTRKAAK